MSPKQMFLLLLLPGLHLAQQSGLALVGGDGSSELWAPGELNCSLPSLDRTVSGLSLDSWGSSLVACQGDTCDQLTPSGWQHWGRTRYFRWYHTSAVTSQGLLLAGGRESLTTTELLPWEGGESREGFSLQHKRNGHCSIQPSPDTVILTGGEYTSLVTEYSGLGAGEEVTSRELPPLPTRRYFHACGCYSMGASQVRQLTPLTPPVSPLGAPSDRGLPWRLTRHHRVAPVHRPGWRCLAYSRPATLSSRWPQCRQARRPPPW